MNRKQYAFPLDFEQVMAGGHLPKVDEESSIHNHLHMILMTQLGQHRFDPDFGCELWNHEFIVEVADPKNNAWKAQMEEALLKAVIEFEKRIEERVRLAIEVQEREEILEDHKKNITKQFSIKVSDMLLKQTGERISNFESTFIFSPITLD